MQSKIDSVTKAHSNNAFFVVPWGGSITNGILYPSFTTDLTLGEAPMSNQN